MKFSFPVFRFLTILFIVCALQDVAGRAFAVDPAQYQLEIQPILTKYCSGCHNATECESGVQLHSYSALKRGGENGPILVPNNADGSKLIRLITHADEPAMPPKDSPQPSAAEIALIRKWIDSGAVGSDADVPLKSRMVPSSIRTRYQGKAPITAAVQVGPHSMLLLGRFGGLELVQNQWRSRLPIDIAGKVSQIRVSKDQRFAVISSGVPGVGGQATVIDLQDEMALRKEPKVIRVIESHRDILYSAVLSPDASILATAGYDRVIQLWRMSDGTLIRKLEGHNGAIYDLDFDETGSVLASASADETIKIWRVRDGERLDTLGQGEAEQLAVRFDASRGRVVATGADKRIRAWQILTLESPSVSPLIHSVFAHEAAVPILQFNEDAALLATAGEDRKIKIWSAKEIQLVGVLGTLDEVPSSLVWNSKANQLIASTLGGDVRSFDLRTLSGAQVLPVSDAESSGNSKSASVPMEQRASAESQVAVSQIEEVNGQHGLGAPQVLTVPAVVTGKLLEQDMHGPNPGDWYAFDAKRGESWVVSIDAARSGSDLDSLIDVTDMDGKPVLRTRLQATRESYFTFRGKDSSNIDDFRLHRWEDMELNEYLYAGGEVVKLWLYPRGPDSGFKTYPGSGSRYTYFGTTATTHALNEPAWIVRELGPGEDSIPNGLPVFPVYYSNDDEPKRRNGKDSELTFVAPTDGRYFVRVRDVRGLSGEKFHYKLSLMPLNPRFQFRLEQGEITLRPNVGTEFSFYVDRFDGCEEAIEITARDLPEGLEMASPIVIEPEQVRAIGMIFTREAVLPSLAKEFSLSFHARTLGRRIEAEVSKPLVVKVNPTPALRSKLVRMDQDTEAEPLTELVIQPGKTISAKLVIYREGNQSDIAFGGDDCGRNLPHGTFVDNIGLNGLLIPAGQSVREVFITAAPITAPQERWFHLRANVDGNPTTAKVLLRVQAGVAK